MKQFDSVLYYVDDDSPDPVVMERVVRAARFQSSRLTLMAVVEPATPEIVATSMDYGLAGIENTLVENRQRQLEEAANTVRDKGVDVSVRVLVGDPLESVIRAVVADGHDLLIKTPSPAAGLRQHLFGSVDMRLMRACPCAVSISRPMSNLDFRRIVAAVDFAPGDDVKGQLNESILLAGALALTGSYSELYVMHAWSLYGEALLERGRGKIPQPEFEEALRREEQSRQTWLEKLTQDFRASLDDVTAAAFHPKLEILHGQPEVAIPERVKELDADILVIGTVGRTGVGGFLIGNTAEAILNRVDSSVVTLKPKGFASPMPAT